VLVSIRSILSNAIETGNSSSLGELLAASGFAEVEAVEMGEALLHYAEAAPLAEAEVLGPAVTSYHSQTHGIEVEGSPMLVDLSFSLPTVDIDAKVASAEVEQGHVSSSNDGSGSGDIDLDGIGPADTDESMISDIDNLNDADDIDNLDTVSLGSSGFGFDGSSPVVGIEDSQSSLIDTDSEEVDSFGAGSSTARNAEPDEWSETVETEFVDSENLPLEELDTSTNESSGSFSSVGDPAELDFEDDTSDIDFD